MDFFTLPLLTLTGIFSVLAGFLAGLLGIGGGVILVPLFLWLFHIAGMPEHLIVHTAFGTSLCVIVPTAISSALGHRLHGNVVWHQVFYLAGGAALGALFGSSLAALLPGAILHKAFGCMEILVGLKLLFYHPYLPPEHQVPPRKSSLLMVGSTGGLFSAFFGVGGGVISVPLMLIVLRLPIHLAVGNSSAVIVISALAGTLSYMFHGMHEAAGIPFSIGYVNLLVAAVVAPLTIVSARLGVRLATSISQDKMIRVFAVLLILLGLKLTF
ncbi:sulfite exporter TauE/SafE family protein [Geopsychrobacter electrodiphilus]|uniref:sulfite exporter TauE/SafE family protein n=1 Tax=Geopsychrobacter electrodiphilus TaxID=225196 RepID=UPI00037A66B7|nr:sulfite exporter TauE/SafE family protein [Geopsychrobacter electrodiphilus]